MSEQESIQHGPDYLQIQMIKAYLQSVRYTDTRIRTSTAALAHIREQYGAINAVGFGEHIRSGQISDTTGSQALQVISAEEKLAADIDHWQRLRDEAAGMIARLDSPVEQDVLTLYYLSGLTWEQTANILHMDVRNVYRIHGRALVSMVRVQQHMAAEG